jgi:1,4-alpha-glucan branching enzyme
MNAATGWSFCQNLTGTVRFVKQRAIQNAEHWPVDPSIVTPGSSGGAGFDVLQHDALRNAVRGAIGQSSAGAGAQVDLDTVAGTLYPPGFAHAWQAVTCVENHDIVKVGQQPRIPRLADGSNARSWYARSRSRVATSLLVTAPGIPQIFMGQEFLEDKQWDCEPASSDLIWWGGLAGGTDPAMVNHLRFAQDLIRLRWAQPAIRGDNVRVFHVHNDNRVIGFHRWIEGIGKDVIVVATLAESTWYGYWIGFPWAGPWLEVFNSDVYDTWVNPQVAGNGGGIYVGGGPMHGFSASAPIVIPANGVVVFARDWGS